MLLIGNYQMQMYAINKAYSKYTDPFLPEMRPKQEFRNTNVTIRETNKNQLPEED